MGTDGNFAGSLPFPGGFSDNFGIHVTGFVNAPAAGLYTFGVNSDDGKSLTINGVTVMNDPSTHGPLDQFAQVNLNAGSNSIDLRFFEATGGATVELFAQPGAFVAWNNGFRLVGDTLNGGLNASISAVPEPSTWLMGILALGASAFAYKRNYKGKAKGG